jgi:hypothetical protein
MKLAVRFVNEKKPIAWLKQIKPSLTTSTK